MLIKYGETNVTDRLLDYKMSVSFADCRMIGNGAINRTDNEVR